MRRLATRGLILLCQGTPKSVAESCFSASSAFSSNIVQQCTSGVQQQANRHQMYKLAMAHIERGFAAGPRTPRPNAQASAARAAGAKAPGAASNAGTAAAAGAAAKSGPSPFSRWWKAFQAAPTAPKALGFLGAIPFIAFATPVTKHLVAVLPAEAVENAAMIQVCYGVTIVSFLGAVHWGVAMGSSLAGPVAAGLANEAFIWSVIPSLAAWPVALMEPGAGAVVMSLLLPACYLADYSRRNKGLPHWYMALRLPLTFLATFGMLLTATRHVHSQLDRAKELAASEPSKPATAAAN